MKTHCHNSGCDSLVYPADHVPSETPSLFDGITRNKDLVFCLSANKRTVGWRPSVGGRAVPHVITFKSCLENLLRGVAGHRGQMKRTRGLMLNTFLTEENDVFRLEAKRVCRSDRQIKPIQTPFAQWKVVRKNLCTITMVGVRVLVYSPSCIFLAGVILLRAIYLQKAPQTVQLAWAGVLSVPQPRPSVWNYLVDRLSA